MKHKVYVGRVKSVDKDSFEDIKRKYKPGTWLREYHNAYAGRSFTAVSSLVSASFYDNPGLDGLLDECNNNLCYQVEAVEFVEN